MTSSNHRRQTVGGAVLLLILTLCYVAPVRRAHGSDGASPGQCIVLVDPDNSVSFSLLHGPKDAERAIGHVSMAGWGPNWAWAGIRSVDKPDGPFVASAPFVVNKRMGQAIAVTLHVTQAGKRSVAFQYDLSADKDVPLTLLAATIGFDKSIGGQFVTAGEKSTALKLPLNKGAMQDVSRATFKLANVGDISIELATPGNVMVDGDARFILAEGKFPAGHKTITLTLTFPSDVALVTAPADVAKFTKPLATADWFPFTPTSDLGPSAIGMEDWLEKPAGKRGGVRMVGDHFQLEDGTPIKFWGTNLAYGGYCAPDKKTADFTAARFAKYGINAVRLHKFTYAVNDSGIGDRNDSIKMDPAGLDRLDYFSSQLKANGVYFGWSHTYGLKVRPGDRSRLLAYDEIVKAFPGGNTYAFINFAPDVQDLMIELVVNLLKHKNPHTGLTYADEPALCFIELQNEDDIFFYTSEKVFNACPTYKKQFMRRFGDFLKTRYGSEEGLRKAWQDALKGDESIAAGNIVPQLNPWFFGDDHLPKTQGGDHQRLLDTAAFLHDVQDQYYGRFVKAIRDAGYKGPINGSPWQAPSMLPHYYNLKSDYAAGYIDRHNYFGGKLSDTMLGQPGSGYLSTGLQQVIDRPFGLSEWITVYPSLFSAEGPALIAAYGMGLQGWSASYEFQSEAAQHAFSNIAGTFPWGVWDTDTPTQLGQFPILARMIYRGDVKQSPVISIRKISDSDLAEGKFSFSDKVSQQGDFKTFTGSVSEKALAAGRVVVEFTPTPQPSTFPDMSKYVQGDTIVSSTGQLRWDFTQRYFTVDTEGTKAVVGFAAGKNIALGNVQILTDTPYASIFLTAAGPKATLATAKTALLTAVARSCNTGFTVFGPGQKVLNNGTSPILMEPVKAAITIAGRRVKAVNVLDADGRRTGKTVLVENERITIDGAREKTIYYEIVFD